MTNTIDEGIWPGYGSLLLLLLFIGLASFGPK